MDEQEKCIQRLFLFGASVNIDGAVFMTYIVTSHQGAILLASHGVHLYTQYFNGSNPKGFALLSLRVTLSQNLARMVLRKERKRRPESTDNNLFVSFSSQFCSTTSKCFYTSRPVPACSDIGTSRLVGVLFVVPSNCMQTVSLA